MKEFIEDRVIVKGKEDFKQLSVFVANSHENNFLLREYLKENGLTDPHFLDIFLKINSQNRNDERMQKIEFLSKQYAINFIKGSYVEYQFLSDDDKKIVDKVALGIIITDMVGLAGFVECEGMDKTRHPAFTTQAVKAGPVNKDREDSVLWYNAQSKAFNKLLNVCAQHDLELYVFENLGEDYVHFLKDIEIQSENPRIQPAFDDEYGAYYEIKAKYSILNTDILENMPEEMIDFLFSKEREEVMLSPVLNKLKVLFKIPEENDSLIHANEFSKVGLFSTLRKQPLKGFEFSQVPFKFFVGSEFENSYSMSNRLGMAPRNSKTGWEKHISWYAMQLEELKTKDIPSIEEENNTLKNK